MNYFKNAVDSKAGGTGTEASFQEKVRDWSQSESGREGGPKMGQTRTGVNGKGAEKHSRGTPPLRTRSPQILRRKLAQE